MIRGWGVILVLVCWVWTQPLHAQQIRQGRLIAGSLTVNTLERQYRLYVPRAYTAGTPSPLVIVLHGGGGKARSMARYVGDSFHAVAEDDGVIVVYPEAVDANWNDGRGLDVTSQRENIDDVAFITTLLDHLSTQLTIDPQRVYATGISNGGHMSFRLACEAPERLAGIAVVAANLSEPLAAVCTPTLPIAVLVMNGTDDPISPYEGGEIRAGNTSRRVLSTDATIQFWVTHNECAAAPIQSTQDDDAGDATALVISRYENCHQNMPVVLYSIVGGGHTWAGMGQYLGERLIGKTSREINGVETIWAFFRGVQRSDE